MLYIHENNIDTKIQKDYNGKKEAFKQFKADFYYPMRNEMMLLEFTENNKKSFKRAAEICNKYYDAIEKFSDKYKVKSQSKFASTFLEEISVYLFKDLPSIKNGTFDVFNKGIYAGMKIASEDDISIIKKDVDFCIGKKVDITIDHEYNESIILPIVAVEVKTYLDATMFGEIKSSSKSIRSATPNSRTYVLMGYKDLADEHIVAARQDATLTEMFALRRSANGEIEWTALYDYWKEVSDAVNSLSNDEYVSPLGRLLFPER